MPPKKAPAKKDMNASGSVSSLVVLLVVTNDNLLVFMLRLVVEEAVLANKSADQ